MAYSVGDQLGRETRAVLERIPRAEHPVDNPYHGYQPVLRRVRLDPALEAGAGGVDGGYPPVQVVVERPEPEAIPYVYVAIRQDLSEAQRLVQVGHAAYSAGGAFGVPADHHLVLIGVKDEQALQLMAGKCQTVGIRCVLFHEPDDQVGFTALCTEALTDQRRLPLKRYRLYRPAA